MKKEENNLQENDKLEKAQQTEHSIIEVPEEDDHSKRPEQVTNFFEIREDLKLYIKALYPFLKYQPRVARNETYNRQII